jgi:hypothetical protein
MGQTVTNFATSAAKAAAIAAATEMALTGSVDPKHVLIAGLTAGTLRVAGSVIQNLAGQVVGTAKDLYSELIDSGVSPAAIEFDPNYMGTDDISYSPEVDLDTTLGALTPDGTGFDIGTQTYDDGSNPMGVGDTLVGEDTGGTGNRTYVSDTEDGAWGQGNDDSNTDNTNNHTGDGTDGLNTKTDWAKVINDAINAAFGTGDKTKTTLPKYEPESPTTRTTEWKMPNNKVTFNPYDDEALKALKEVWNNRRAGIVNRALS